MGQLTFDLEKFYWLDEQKMADLRRIESEYSGENNRATKDEEKDEAVESSVSTTTEDTEDVMLD